MNRSRRDLSCWSLTKAKTKEGKEELTDSSFEFLNIVGVQHRWKMKLFLSLLQRWTILRSEAPITAWPTNHLWTDESRWIASATTTIGTPRVGKKRDLGDEIGIFGASSVYMLRCMRPFSTEQKWNFSFRFCNGRYIPWRSAKNRARDQQAMYVLAASLRMICVGSFNKGYPPRKLERRETLVKRLGRLLIKVYVAIQT